MENQIYIPKKLKVGYQKRTDTYSKKIAYVIYYDDKNKLRKETSWKGWVDAKMGIDEFDNEPMEGFVLNRNVGGARQSYGWDTRIEKVRVYDPRGFEFEIDLPNVLFILNECTSTKGKGLEGTFVYGWSGPSLILIPTTCEEYKKSQVFTGLQSAKVGARELVPGCSYKTKKQQDLIYLGKFDWFERNYRKDSLWTATKKFVFVDENGHLGNYEVDREDYETDKEYDDDVKAMAKEAAKALADGDNYNFVPFASVSNLALCNSETPVSNYADLMTRFSKTINAGIPVEFVEKPATPKPEFKKESYGWWGNKDTGDYFLKQADDKYVMVSIEPSERYGYNDTKTPDKWVVNKNRNLAIVKGVFKSDYNSSYSEREKKYTTEDIMKLGLVKLKVKLNNNQLVDAKKYC